MSSTGGGIVARHGTQTTYTHAGKYLTIDNQSTTLDLTLTEDQANTMIDALGNTGGIESAYLMVWGFGT